MTTRPGVSEDGALAWYVAYGSNLSRRRFDCYLRGGVPPGGRRANPGARNPAPPLATQPVWLSGTVYFALESSVWSGGMAFYDADAPGATPARAYLITVGQFSDVVAQEMRRAVGIDLDLGSVIADRRVQLGPGRYDTLVACGTLDGVGMVTATAPWATAAVELNAPSAPYLRMLAAGLRETHQFTGRQCAVYLASRPGAAGTWSAEQVLEVVGDEPHRTREPRPCGPATSGV